MDGRVEPGHGGQVFRLVQIGRSRRHFRLVGIIRVFVGAQLVGRVGHVEARRRDGFQEAGGLELVQARQVADAFQPELDQEGLGGAVGDRAARGALAATDLDPADLHQDVDGARGHGDTANVLDLRPGDRLMVGDDGQGFDGGLGQALLFRLFLAQQEGQIAGGAELIFSRDTAKVYTALLLYCFKGFQNARNVRAFRQRC
jgi:hypothetical protein